MPIEGLSEVRRIPRLGKIRLGVKQVSQKGNEYPVAVDYFVVEPPVAKVYGEKPTELPVLFATEDMPDQWYKAYSKSRGRICRGDGRTATALIDLETGEVAAASAKETEYREIPCDPENCHLYKKKQCHRIMNLMVVLPEVPGIGVWQLDTGSKNSIKNVNNTLRLVQSMKGHFSGVRLMLRLVPEQTQVDGKAKTIHVLRLESEHSFDELMRQPCLLEGRIALPDAETGSAPDDLYPDDMIADEPRQLHAPAAKCDAPAPESDKEKPKRGRPAKQATQEQAKPAAQTALIPESSIQPIPAMVALPEPEAGNLPEPDAAKAAIEAHNQLVNICTGVDSDFYREVIVPLEATTNMTDEMALSWLREPASDLDVRSLIAGMRGKGIDDAAIRGIAEKTIGRRPALPFTTLEYQKILRHARTQDAPTEDERDILDDFEG